MEQYNSISDIDENLIYIYKFKIFKVTHLSIPYAIIAN